MLLSSGGRSLLSDVIGWMFAATVLAVALVYATEIKAIGYWLVGVEPPPGVSIAGVRPSGDQSSQARPSGRTVELSAGQGGHFMTEAEINGRRVDVMVDTGATIIALTYDDARAIGVAPGPGDYTHRVSTANGMARVAPVLLDRVQIGDIMVRRVQAAVIEPGKLKTTLLGNSFLSRLSRYEMRGGRLIMEE